MRRIAAQSHLDAALVALADPTRRAILRCLDPDPEKRPASASAVSAMTQTLLLDATTTARRLLQVGLPLVGVLLFVQGPMLLTRLPAADRWWAILPTLAGLAIIGSVMRFPLQWEVRYKGHRIRFQNHPLFGERLYIDNVLVARGRPGLHITLHGTIESGEGAGERITAQSRAGLFTFSCRIVAESFG